MTEETIFAAALELKSVERAAYLASVCGDDAALRKRLEGLLSASDRAGSFMARPAIALEEATAIVEGESTPHDATITRDGSPPAADDQDESLGFLTPSTRPDSLGRIGHYEVLQVLGRGGFGIVFRAFDDILQRVVAIKVMAPQLAATSPARKRFLREARSSAQVRHENVVQVYEIGEQPLPYLSMEFIPGETLQTRLNRVGPLDVPECLRIGRQIAEGLAAAHATDLIHRDIKPSNVLIEGGQGRVKITDFGLARAADDASISQSGIIAGTPMYMAPEQALGHKLDQRADIFSLGSVLYQMVSGRPPFRANTTVAVLKRVAEHTPRPIREIIPETPQWLCDIIAKLHAKDPDDRYQSAREVADVLADCETQLKTNSKVTNFARIPRRKPEPRHLGPWKWVAVTALAFVLLMVGTFGLYRLIGPKPLRDDERWVAIADGQEILGWGHAIDPDGDGGIEAMPGHVRMTVPTKHDLNGMTKAYNSPRVMSSVRGDFRAKVCVHPFIDPKTFRRTTTSPYLTASLVLWSDEDHFARVDRVIQFEPDMGGRNQRHDAVAFHPARPILGPIPLDLRRIEPRSPSWLELERRGNVVSARTSIDNKNWSAPFQLPPLDLPDNLQIGVAVMCVNAPAPLRVEFQDFEVTPLEASPVKEDGFVELFNHKDLTGWKTRPEAPGHWEVADGNLIGSRQRSVLYSERGDYANFHLRVETKVNLGGDSGVFFRCGFGTPPENQARQFGPAGGFEVEIHKDLTIGRKTGSVTILQTGGPPVILGLTSDDSLTQPDEWFTLEIIVQQDRFITKVNGKETANCRDPLGNPPSGHIGLQVWSPNTIVQFREIEIKELPPSPFKNSLGMEFMLVPKGKARLGGGTGVVGEHGVEPVHEVEIAQDFYLGKYEVTQEEWQKVMGNNPSSLSRTGAGKEFVKDVADGELARFPVDNVSWDDCQKFVARVNEQSKDSGWVYRLPTQAQWEYACRGGPLADRRDSAFDFYGEKPSNQLLPGQANIVGKGKTCQVGSYPANRLGLHDMHGNVWEWCDDVYDPKDAAAVSLRAIRGGCWVDGPENCRAAVRHGTEKSLQSHFFGLRLARVPIKSPAPEAKTPPLAKQEPLPPAFKNTIGMEFVIVPKGRAWLGGSAAKLGDKEVDIPADFYLGKFEVTQEEWVKVMNENPSHFSRTGPGKDVVKGISDEELKRFPVESVSWERCQEFVTKLNQLEKGTGWAYRLPTEQEWEYACRGGPMANKADSGFDYYFLKPTKTLFPELANFGKTKGWNRPVKVGMFERNSLGLHDMHGNVQEWCTTDVPGDAAASSQRMNRGGSWWVDATRCRAATRETPAPTNRIGNALGLRVARVWSVEPEVLKDAKEK
jgi:formylglycine-generating enzyme required for sulfatase activity